MGTDYNVFQKAPNSIVAVCATVVAVTVIAAFAILAYAGRDAAELSRLVNTMLNSLGVLTGTGAILYSSAAAKSASKAEEQTNGALDRRIQEAVVMAMRQIDREGGSNDGRPSL